MKFELDPVRQQLSATVQELSACNQISARYGLSLSRPQMEALAVHRLDTLKNTGRVEFGGGVLKKLVEAFCDSPYVMQDEYESTLEELQELFYHFKNESAEQISDEELIDVMKTVFNGRAQGSLEYLAGTALEDLCRTARGGQTGDPEPEEGGPDEEEWDDE